MQAADAPLGALRCRVSRSRVTRGASRRIPKSRPHASSSLAELHRRLVGKSRTAHVFVDVVERDPERERVPPFCVRNCGALGNDMSLGQAESAPEELAARRPPYGCRKFGFAGKPAHSRMTVRVLAPHTLGSSRRQRLRGARSPQPRLLPARGLFLRLGLARLARLAWRRILLRPLR
jgi:hypothetical protein